MDLIQAKIIRYFCLALVTTLFIAPPASAYDAQDADKPVEDPVDEPAVLDELEVDDSLIDEITVIEQKRIVQLRADLRRADARLFALYNDLNTNDSLDMICKKEARTGSQIVYQVCKSAYHRYVESESASDFLSGDGGSPSAKVPASHYNKVRANMENLLESSPELRRAFIERAVLRKKINEKKETQER